MLKQLYRYFQIITSSKSAVFVLLVTLDIGNLSYLKTYHLSKLMRPENYQYWINQVGGVRPLNSTLMAEMTALLNSTLSLGLFLILLFNTIMYILFIKDKRMGIKYVKGYSLAAVIFSFFEFLHFFNNFSWWVFYIAFTTIIYLMMYKTVKAQEKRGTKN